MLVVIRTDYPTNIHTEQGLAHKSSHQNPWESENQAAECKQRPQDLAQRKFVELTAPHLYRDHLMITRLPRSSKMAHLCLTTRMLWERSLLSKDSETPSSLPPAASQSPHAPTLSLLCSHCCLSTSAAAFWPCRQDQWLSDPFANTSRLTALPAGIHQHVLGNCLHRWQQVAGKLFNPLPCALKTALCFEQAALSWSAVTKLWLYQCWSN